MLFDSIEEAVTRLLYESKVGIPKGNFVLGKLSPPPSKKGELPAVAIYDSEISFDEQTLGSNVKEERKESVEAFAGNGRESTFILSTKPLRPLLRVESPQGSVKRENVDFKVNYEKGAIQFNSPPEKSVEKNVVVQFFPLKVVSLISGLRVNAKYNLEVWGSNRDECNDLSIDIVKAIVFGREKLASQGIVMRPISASGIETENSTPASTVFGRRLICSVETDLYMATPVPAIERIELRNKDFESLDEAMAR